MTAAPAESARPAPGEPDGPRPSFPLLRKLDAAWYRFERALCGGMFMLMALIVFAAVVRDVFGTRHNWMDALMLFVLVLGAFLTRVPHADRPDRGWAFRIASAGVPAMVETVGIALAITIAVVGLVELYVTLLPGGFLWASKAALCLMLWVGFLGASVATYEKAHLALEFGEKIWPKGIRHFVKALAHALTSAACIVLFLLSVESLAAHHANWSAADGFADTIPTLPWLPQWVVFLVFPYTFVAMAVRFGAQMVTAATRTDVAHEGGPT